MRKRKNNDPVIDETDDTSSNRTNSGVHQEAELEQAIAERIGDDSHQWVDIEFTYQGESGSYYQILDVHHNLTALDEDARIALDGVTREWDLTLQEEMTAANKLTFQTLTLHSEDPRDHRKLAEAILDRVYDVTLTGITISQVDGESR